MGGHDESTGGVGFAGAEEEMIQPCENGIYMDTKTNPKLLCDFAEIVNTTLSLKDTFFLKYVFTPSWIIIYWPVVVFSFGDHIDWRLHVLLFILWLMFSVHFYWTYARVKEVSFSEGKLIVSNFIKKICVDISEVESIGGSIFLYPEFIWLNLKNNSEFGKKIIFIAKPRETFFSSLAFGRHPLVEKLTNLIEQYANHTTAGGRGDWD